MNLIQRIIVWLATRFLTKQATQDLFIEKNLIGQNEGAALRDLFRRYSVTKSFSCIAMDHLSYVFSTGELAKLVFYQTVKNHVRVCPSAECNDVEEFFDKLASNEATNPMKRLANFKAILRTALYNVSEEEIAVLAQIAMTINVANRAAQVKYMETI